MPPATVTEQEAQWFGDIVDVLAQRSIFGRRSASSSSRFNGQPFGPFFGAQRLRRHPRHDDLLESLSLRLARRDLFS